ncbi:MAG TPA: MFS transporter [Pirellulales bacterium]|jgi:MFS family permease|nr:MFS transporter [Pirellulales bacterium]
MSASSLNPGLGQNSGAIAPNAMRLLIAGFMAILAAGVGFAIRGGIFDDWVKAFNFTQLEVGLINGAGFTGFCFGIIIGGMIVDRIGYGKLVAVAFLLHVVSALVTFGATDGMAPKTAFVFLWTGTFLFAVANGTLEGVANPLVATLFPNNRTHYLNILHASWPAGLVLGGFIHTGLADLNWKVQLGCFLIPAVLYGAMFLGQHFPKSEASAKGLSLGQMLRDVGILGAAVIGLFVFLFVKDGLGPLLNGFVGGGFFAGQTWFYVSAICGGAVMLSFAGASRWTIGAPLLCVLFITHALVGAVELGTDGWIQNIEDAILTKGDGTKLFIYTSALMFGLRFCGHFIEHKLGLKPVGILFVCAILACVGLNLVSHVTTFIGALAALTVYAVGKTFFWPTMLAVASDQFPRCGAIAISIMGGLGMMSAGLVGSPGLGYAKDRFAGENLSKANQAIYSEFKAKEPSKWLVFEEVYGIDGQKLEAARAVEPTKRTPDQTAVVDAYVDANRQTLRVDSIIPATMAGIYLLMFLYFQSIGGYKALHVGDEITGGIAGPMEA